MPDKNIFNVYGGLDTRKSFGIEKESGVISFDEAKNIDILGKSIRRCKGQEQKLQISGEAIKGIAEHEINGIKYMSVVTDAHKYYRIDDTTWTASEANDFDPGDISTASYASKFYTPSEATALIGLFFKSDGTKMYVTDDTTDSIYQYSLSTAWDVSTASYDTGKTLDLNPSNDPRGIYIKSDGTRLFLASNSPDGVYSYTFSTPWDVGTLTYDSKYKDIGPNFPSGIWFNPDGTRMFLSDGIGRYIYQIELSTAWDITTATWVLADRMQINATNNVRDIFFNSSGTKLYATVLSGSYTEQHNLSTPYEILSGVTYVTTSPNHTPYGQAATGLAFSSDGIKMYLADSQNDIVYQWDSPDINAAGALAPYFFQFQNKLVVITGMTDPFTDDGTTITQTGLYTARSVYGTCGAAFNGRIFIGSGNAIYWTAANSTTDWTTANDAGFKTDLNGTVVDMRVFGSYLMIWTTSDVYYLSGYDPSDFKFDHWSDNGVSSRFANVEFDERIYTFYNKALFPIEVTGDIAQVRFQNPLSYKISDLLEEVNSDRLDEIIVVPYEKRKQIWCYVPVDTGSTIYKAYVLNLINQDTNAPSAWYTREGNAITCAAQFKGEVYTGTINGEIYKEDSGDDFDGNAIVSTLWFTAFTFGSSRVKNCEEFKAWFDIQNDNKFDFKLKYDGEEDDIDTNAVDLSSDSKAVVGRISELIPLRDEFTTIQIGLSTDALDEDYILYGGTFMNLRTTNEY